MSFSEWIILHTGGQLWYNYFIPPYICEDLANEKFHAKVGKGDINVVVCLFKQSVKRLGTKMSDMIWVQIVCHFDDNPDFFLIFLKLVLKKSVE